MIHPSYFELMNIVNKDVKEGEAPIITSRYSIVLGTAKRARQLVAANHTTYRGQEEKPLSIAVDELKNGEIHIIRNEEVLYSDEEHLPDEELLYSMDGYPEGDEAPEDESPEDDLLEDDLLEDEPEEETDMQEEEAADEQ